MSARVHSYCLRLPFMSDDTLLPNAFKTSRQKVDEIQVDEHDTEHDEEDGEQGAKQDKVRSADSQSDLRSRRSTQPASRMILPSVMR